MKYARVLIEHCPKEATDVFIAYYTGKYQPRVDPPTVDSTGHVAATNGGFAAGAANAVQNLSSLLPLPYMNTTAVVGTSKPTVGDAVVKPEAIPISYTPPRPRTAFSSFIDHPDEFIVFLEACLQEESLSSSDKTDINTTLFEMYLHKSNEKSTDESHREKWEAKAKALIEEDKGATSVPKPSIENSNVLLLSHLSDFRAGTTLVKEQSGLLFDIFRSYTSAKDTRGAIKALRKYGPEEPQLYPAALAYLTSDQKILDEAGPEELDTILSHIDKFGLMAPLQVVQTLSKNKVATMGMIKPYLAKRIERERKDIEENKGHLVAFRTETEEKRRQIKELEGEPVVFQNTRCSACGAGLELPVVHFLCKHSFHRRCLRQVPGSSAGGLGGGEMGGGGKETLGECPTCAVENDTIRALKRGQVENAERHELFRDGLERSEDRFRTVAEWFGRGVMSAGGANS